MLQTANIRVRHETPDDFRLAEEITREAFWNLHSPGCDEHFVVHQLRSHADYLPEFSFVIEREGRVVGCIYYSRSKVVAEDGKVTEVITFGPVSILPELHRQGLGRALITHSMEAARAAGHRAILIGGFPYHYAPYGFEGAKKYGISLPDGNFYTGIMALPLYPGALDGVSGKLYFSDAYEVDPAALEAFEKTFPPKEKRVKPSQQEFAKAVVEVDTREWEGTVNKN